jgi:DNA-binding response OmpR family regulator
MTPLPILICEDDPDIATLLSLILQQGGFPTKIASNATQAKQTLSQDQFAAMTLDLALPDQDGISLIRELRQIPLLESLPIVVVSAMAEQGRLETLAGGGVAVVDWLEKPIRQDRLMTAVLQAARQRQQGKPCILHVEDDADVVHVVATVLQDIADLNYVGTLQQAREILDQDPFDLIIVDLQLPDGSGLDLLTCLQSPLNASTPIVIFSAQEVESSAVHQVAAALVKARTTNQDLLETIRSLVADHG